MFVLVEPPSPQPSPFPGPSPPPPPDGGEPPGWRKRRNEFSVVNWKVIL